MIIPNGLETTQLLNLIISIIIKPFWEISVIKHILWSGIWVGADIDSYSVQLFIKILHKNDYIITKLIRGRPIFNDKWLVIIIT